MSLVRWSFCLFRLDSVFRMFFPSPYDARCGISSWPYHARILKQFEAYHQKNKLAASSRARCCRARNNLYTALFRKLNLAAPPAVRARRGRYASATCKTSNTEWRWSIGGCVVRVVVRDREASLAAPLNKRFKDTFPN